MIPNVFEYQGIILFSAAYVISLFFRFFLRSYAITIILPTIVTIYQNS